MIFLLFFGCSLKKELEQKIEHKPDSIAVAFNSKAVNYLSKVIDVDDSLWNSYYDSSLVYLCKAIELDSLYLNAYTNKAQVLVKIGLLTEALETLSKAEKIRPNFAEVIMGQGFIFEKMGDLKEAQKKYKEALQAYSSRLEIDSLKDNTKMDIAFLYIFLEDKRRAIDEIHDLILSDPKNKMYYEFEDMIEGFDREKFIKEY